ncbi:MAG: hypothetical protein AAGG69_13635 [Pseudomonadota bacterium]
MSLNVRTKWLERVLLLIAVACIGLFMSPWALDIGLLFNPHAFEGAGEIGAPKAAPELILLVFAVLAFIAFGFLAALRAFFARGGEA